MPMLQAIGWATFILVVAFAGRAAGFDAEPLVLVIAGAAAAHIARPGCGGAAA